jgi:hypothetical protein
MSAGKTYIKIASQTLTSGQVEVLFQNIPQNYTDLLIVVSATENNSDGMDMRVGNNSIDSSSNYSVTWFRGNGSAASSYRVLNYSSMEVGNVNSTVSNFIINLNNYSNTTTFKTAISRSNNTTQFAATTVSCWRNTSAINQISFKNGSYVNHLPSSTFTIYGIECAKNPYAEGGDKVYSTGTHWVHEFYNSGLFVPRQSLTADYLVIAGGGSGGGNGGSSRGAGGGGAGGYLTSIGGSSISLSASGYTVVVGAGGAATTGEYPGVGKNGTNSSFSGLGISTITAIGGGGGGAYLAPNYTNGFSGGSGGGASGQGGLTGGAATSGQGNAGGNGEETNFAAGGGGGAGSAGGNASGGVPGNGGSGLASSITGVSTTRAGGGGGSTRSASSGSGGSGGGGAAGSGNGTNATANTGSGGGAAGTTTSGPLTTSGSGGSGIVIVRYPV